MRSRGLWDTPVASRDAPGRVQGVSGGCFGGAQGSLGELLGCLLEPRGSVFGYFLRSREGPGAKRGDMLDLQYPQHENMFF